MAESETIVVQDPKVLTNIDLLREQTVNKLTLSQEILQKNSTFSPWRLEDLKRRIMNTDVISYMPLKPYSPGEYARLQKIIQLFAETLVPMHGSSYEFYTWLSHEWMYGRPLGQLIDGALKKKKQKGEDSSSERAISGVVRDLVHDIDDILRFRLVGAFKAYTDILGHCLDLKGMSDEKEEIPAIHIYLEFGMTA